MGQGALLFTSVDGSAGNWAEPGLVLAELRLFRRTADCVPDGVAITAQPLECEPPALLYANPAFTALSGLTADRPADQQLGDDAASGLLPKDNPFAKALTESHQGEDVFSTDVLLCEENGCSSVLRLRSEPVCDETGQITHRVAVVRNVSQQAALEDASRRNERLACIGLLAAGIAHEINNPTGSALLAAETALAMLDFPEADPHVVACLQNIVASMDRCGRIVRTLLRYSREEPSEKQACSVNDVAQQAADLARPYAERHGAELRLELDQDAPLVPMNPLEIELVLVNLLRNAIEAGNGKAAVSIRTGRTETGARLAVGDNGCGMNQEQLAHVFDPLYTTRRQFGGSGLGMSIAYGMVQGHGGRMVVQSKPGVGTTVTIDLPFAREKETDPTCRSDS